MLACFCVKSLILAKYLMLQTQNTFYTFQSWLVFDGITLKAENATLHNYVAQKSHMYVKVISEIAGSSVLIESQNTINFCLCVWNLSNWNSNFIFNLILTFIFYFCVYRYDCGSYICGVTHVEAKRELLVVRSFLPWCGFWGLNQIIRLGDRQSCHFVSLYSVSFENQTF